VICAEIMNNIVIKVKRSVMLAVDGEWAVLKFRSTLNFFGSHRHAIHRQMIGLVGSRLWT